MAERSNAPGCKLGALRATGVQIPLLPPNHTLPRGIDTIKELLLTRAKKVTKQ